MGLLRIRVTWTVFALCVSAAAHADFSDECRGLADRLAREPATLKVGDLDILKNCLSSLQRGIVLGEPAPASSPPPTCTPAVVAPPVVCPVCPAAAQLCPRREASSKERDVTPARERTRDPASEDRRLKPYLPQY